MKPICFKLYCILLVKICFISLTNAEIGEDTWLDPDAWARDHIDSSALQSTNDECCKCSDNLLLGYVDPIEADKEQRPTPAEDLASLIYFKKLVSMLFNRKNFKYDSTQQLYERSVVFTIQSNQMDKLEQLKDPRDLDNILTEIISNVRTPNTYFDGQQLFHSREASTGIKTIVLNILCDMLQLMKTSEMRFLLVVTIVAIIAWIINNRFKIGWLALAFGGIFIYGYLYTYLECNRELEVNQMLDILNRNKGYDKNARGSKFISFFKGMFYTEDNEKQKLKQSATLTFGFCRPDHVLIKYFNDIFIKYLEVLIEQYTITLTTLYNALGFPYTLLFGFFFTWLIGYILKLTFKYIISPSAWAQFMNRKQPFYPEQATIKSTIISQDDRISGDNLKLLLNAFNSAPQRMSGVPTLPSTTGVSGVEDVSEAVEPIIEKTSQVLKEDTFEKNKKSNENVKIEDLSKDS